MSLVPFDFRGNRIRVMHIEAVPWWAAAAALKALT
jgi:prophage antirepressor-like protein